MADRLEWEALLTSIRHELPQPVHVRLQVCSGSSCSTMANRGVRKSLCLMM